MPAKIIRADDKLKAPIEISNALISFELRIRKKRLEMETCNAGSTHLRLASQLSDIIFLMARRGGR